MRTTILLFFFLAAVTTASAQTPKISSSLVRKLHPAGEAPHYRMNNDIAVFVKGDVAAIREEISRLGGRFKYAAGDIAAVVLPLGRIPELAHEAFVQRIEDNDLKLQPLNDQVLLNSHALEVHNGWNLPQAYDGAGVIVGIIDEGIDFTHPDFRNSDGTTRIRYLWDQSIVGNTFNPQPFGYGKEFVGSQIDTSTEHFDAVFSHGSHVTGIACGNGNALNNYRGVAPKAEIIVVKMNLNTSDDNFLTSLVDAVQYIYFKADSLGMPAVINVSLGTYWGSHDARDIQAQAISNIISSAPGRALVCAAGNLGNAPIHLGYDVSSDTAMTWLQYSGSPIFIQAWGDTSDFENIRFSMGVDRVQPDLQSLAVTPFTTVLPVVGLERIDTLRNANGNRLGIVHSYGDYRFGSYSMEYLIYPDSSYRVSGPDTSRYLWRFSATGAGRLDAWSGDMVFDNLPDSTAFPPIRYYHRPDLEQNIVSSFSCSDKVITVGAFTNRNSYTNVNFTVTSAPTLQPGALWVQSSHGPTRDHRVKPDVVAAGDWVLSCGTRYELPLLAAVEPAKVAAGGKHKRSSGTSMSSPVVCGIGALYFQRHPTATWLDFKNALLGCTDMDSLTGSALPDIYWGYGKANAYKTVGGCAVGIEETAPYRPSRLTVRPNPVSDAADVDYDLGALAPGQTEVFLFDAMGRKVLQETLSDRKGSFRLQRTGLSDGMYLLTLFRGGALVASSRLVIR